MKLNGFGNFLFMGRFLPMIVRELDCTKLLAMNPFERSFVATMYRGETTHVGIRQSIFRLLIECAEIATLWDAGAGLQPPEASVAGAAVGS